jgi:hypothetical protein
MPFYLLRLFGDTEEKRKRDDAMALTDADASRLSKRRCMDGSSLVAVNADAPTEILFSQIMFDTELNCAIPLTFLPPQLSVPSMMKAR